MLIRLTKQVYNGYNKFVIKNPLFGMALTSGAGMSLGNLICQALMYKKSQKFNFYQVAQYGAFGFFISVGFFLSNQLQAS